MRVLSAAFALAAALPVSAQEAAARRAVPPTQIDGDAASVLRVMPSPRLPSRSPEPLLATGIMPPGASASSAGVAAADDVAPYVPPEPGPVLTRALFERIQALRARGQLQEAAAAAAELAGSADPDSLYFLGSVAQEAGEYELAASAYERAVMIDPDFAGAWLDLATVTRLGGDDATAQALFDYVLDTFAPPPELRAKIAVLRRQTIAPALAAVAPTPGGWHGELRAQIGHDTNANNGITLGSLPLLLGGTVVELPIADEERARGDMALQASALLRYGHRFNDSGSRRGELLMSLTQRANRDLSDSDTRDLLFGGNLVQDTDWGSFSQRLTFQQVRLGGRDLLYGVRAGLGWDVPVGRCRVGLGTEFEYRHYAQYDKLDAGIVWLQAGGGCLTQVGGMPVQAALLTRVGRDGAVHDRAGGDATRYEFTSVVAAELRPRLVLEGLLAFSQARDSTRYSAILLDDAVRRVTRTQARLQLLFPLLGPVDGFVAIERLRQDANLSLFEQHGRIIWTGIRYGF